MKSFSQRYGFKPLKDIIQVDSMDDDLRNGLWNVLYVDFFERFDDQSPAFIYAALNIFFRLFWHNYLKRPIDNLLNLSNAQVIAVLKRNVLEAPWYEVYDLLEFVAQNCPDEDRRPGFISSCNFILKRELSAYRFVGGMIAKISSEEEIAAIEEALEVPGPFGPVSNHLKRALELLADRESPDYRNSIKESISAVEALCALLTGNPKAALGQALKQVEAKSGLHPALKSAFSSLYGYTSDAEGIRHALLEEPNLDFEDAKFMLVSCSAFANYLVSKASKAGLF